MDYFVHFVFAVLISILGLIIIISIVEGVSALCRYITRRRRINSVPNVYPSAHCCGIYAMSDIQVDPRKCNINALVNQTKYYGSNARIIEFSDAAGFAGQYLFGDQWRDYLIKIGYQVNKIELGVNPKTDRKIALYHWFLAPRGSETAKLSMTREYTYEQEKQERADADRESKSRGASGNRVLRDKLGRFARRIRRLAP